MKKKILFLNCDAAWYGSEKVLFYTIKTLSTRYDCHVILPYYGILNKRLEAHGINPEIMNYPIFRKKCLTPAGIIRYSVEYICSIFRLIYYIKRKKIDLIYSNSTTVLEGFLIALILKKQHIWHHHHVIEKPRIVLILIRQIIKMSKGINIFVSHALMNKYGFKESQKYSILHNGIEPIEIVNTHRPKRDDFSLGFLGTFNRQKGQIYLLHAIRYLISHY
ncbi:MAG: glycosyltransferase family 4 protein, partial [Fibrobacter sp.]|nr:glycosyltransferase family 4 protein [Fibrobacter sp.]